MTIPPLRQWPALPAFIQRLWHELGGDVRGITLAPALVTTLARHPWPGNVRQLRSVLKVLLALADDHTQLDNDDLPAEYRETEHDAGGERQKQDERLIAETLARYNGNISKAAQALGVARSTLYRRGARAGGE